MSIEYGDGDDKIWVIPTIVFIDISSVNHGSRRVSKFELDRKPLHQFFTGPQCDAVEDGGNDDHE